jgi:formylglycine-generating enzyme required for sulfatase activity
MVRGGSWRSPGKLCRSGTRVPHLWSTGDYETGFRVALVQLDPQPKPVPQPIDPKPLPPGILVNSIGMKLAPIPAGTFFMGSPVDEDRRPWLGRDEVDYEEHHPVTIREPFYMGVYLVTQEQYQQIMGNHPGYKPSYFSHEGEGKDKVKQFADTRQFPRENVWSGDVQEFCRRLSELPEEKKLGRVYRLPTEEEWEYACRAGTTTPYYCGKTLTPQDANIAESKLGRTTPVGQYPPNHFGLYDMHGNVLERCQGSLAPYQEDLRSSGTGYSYVGRGGCWIYSGVFARSACRQEAKGSMYCGFRVAVSVSSGTR